MEQKELEEKIKEYFLKLPPELQEVVGNGKWVDAVTAIAKNNGLNIVQTGQLQNEVMLVMLGVVHPDKFLWDIKDAIGLPKEKIDKLIRETGDAVFLPVRQKLMSVYSRNIAEEEENETAIAPQEKSVLDKAGISIENGNGISMNQPPEKRRELIQGIENPVKSTPTVLNEPKATPPTNLPVNGPKVTDIPVPRAPYAGATPSQTPKQQPVPVASKPTSDIMAGKLGGAFTVAKKDTDYSIKNIGGVNTSKSPTGDSYREPIE